MKKEIFENVNRNALEKVRKLIEHFEKLIENNKEPILNISTDFYLQELILSRSENYMINAIINLFEKESSCRFVIKFGYVLLIPKTE